jgi:rubrerythrin
VSIDFTADEVFEMAEQIERNGAAFYRKAAAGFTDEASRKFLLGLAADEVDHEKTFRKLREGLTAGTSGPDTFDPGDEAAEYLKAMSSGHVFDTKTDPSSTLKGKETMEDILHRAIGLEKDSVVFYLGMKEAVPAKAGKASIDAIIREEMTHITRLTGHLSVARRKR